MLQPRPVARVRQASRTVVRELGFLRPTLAQSGLSPSSVHALIEIGATEGLSARDLVERLVLEKSTVSRLIRGLEERELVAREPAQEDGRRRVLRLTPSGLRTLMAIDSFAESQVAMALGTVGPADAETAACGLELYGDALRNVRTGATNLSRVDPSGIVIEHGYRAGLLGRLLELQIQTFTKLCGFGIAFESAVAAGMADFFPRLAAPCNATWRVQHGGEIMGGLTIDGEDLNTDGSNSIAHLRWFILAPSVRGRGVGAHLMETAMAFCDSYGFEEIRLDTVDGLAAARALYERHGFVLENERPGRTWGPEMTEQTFRRRRQP